MPILLKQNQDTEYQPAAEGTYPAVCIDVIEAFNVTSFYQGKESINDKITFVFQNAQGEQIWSDRFNSSAFIKSALAKFLTRWAGKTLSQENLNRMDVEKCIGKPAFVSVEHSISKSNQKTYANVKVALPLPQGVEAPIPDPNYVRRKHRPADGQPGSKAIATTYRNPPLAQTSRQNPYEVVGDTGFHGTMDSDEVDSEIPF